MSDQSEKLEHFKSVTGVNDERAKFYLDSASGSLEIALASFYDGEGEAEANSDVEIVESPPQPTSEAKAKATPPKKPNPRFATIHNLNSSSDDEEEGQAFYAGGSEHSGQQVLGPKKKDFVRDMFKSVQEHGMEVMDEKPSSSSGKAFKGTGYKLGQTENDSEAVPGVPEPPKPVQATLKLWKDGFSVDGGPLRMYTDPANQEFLNSVRRGEIPHELRQGRSEVHVSMEDHRNETFTTSTEPRSRHVFQGPGHTLGSPVPPTIGAPFADDQQVNESNARDCLNLDRSQPTTNLQIRLADGSRLVGEFNHQHTVEEIRNYIISARPQFQTRTFALLGAFPPRELDGAQTIAGAGLLNSAIIQKLT